MATTDLEVWLNKPLGPKRQYPCITLKANMITRVISSDRGVPQVYEVKTQSLDEQISEEIGVSTEDKDTDLGQ